MQETNSNTFTWDWIDAAEVGKHHKARNVTTSSVKNSTGEFERAFTMRFSSMNFMKEAQANFFIAGIRFEEAKMNLNVYEKQPMTAAQYLGRK